MAGQLQGLWFKIIIGNMLASNVLFPEYRARVAAMQDDAWYPWDEYKQMVNAIAERLGPTVIRQLGIKMITEAKDQQAALGWDSPERCFADYAAYTRPIMQGVPESERYRTLSYTPGHAVVEAGIGQPPALIEGYVRANVTRHGRTLLSVSHTRHEGPPFPTHRFEVRWK